MCSIDRLGGADDCDLCCEYCKATEEGNNDCRGCAINQCFNKLGEYETLEEQGKLLKLPCTVGDTVWYGDKEYDPIEEAPFEGYVSGYEIVSGKTIYIIIVPKKNFIPAWNDNSKYKIEIEEFGKTVFLTKEEAEAALKELEDRNA